MTVFRRFSALLAVFVIFLAPSFGFASGTVKGKVSHSGKGLPGASVSFYYVGEGKIVGKPAFEIPATQEDGSFEAAVDPGQYFIVVRKSADPQKPGSAGDFYSYYGGNPVVVGEGETINVGMNTTQIMPVDQPFKNGGTGIKGTVYADDAPLSRARITLYTDASTIFRGIGYASVVTNDRGEFSITLEPGEYYVISRKRVGDDKMGPLGQGDFFGFAQDNPVVVEDGRFTVISINSSSKNVRVKEGGQDITLGGTLKAGETTISGVVKDREGKPVPKIFAAVYRDSMMTQKPDFISPATGPDGTFTISLPEGGEYFLGARNTLGGPAERGDLLGRFNGNEDHMITIKSGDKLTGIELVVLPVE